MVSVVLQQAETAPDYWLTWAPAAASAVIAALALVLGLDNRRTSKHALKLAQQHEDRQVARLDVDLKDAVSVSSKCWKHRQIGIHVLMINPTDRQSAIFKGELNITYSTPDGVRTVVTVPHDPGDGELANEVIPLEIPAHLPANGAIRGWLTFRLENDLLASMRIERYELVLYDSRGPVKTVYPWLFRELDDEAAST